jgi:hypothetical protein
MMAPVEQAQMPRPAEKSHVNFSDGDREAHLRAFYAWLPTELHDAPGISWAHASSRILGYCVKTVGQSPDKGYVALAIGAAIGSLGQASLHQYLSRFYQLLCMLRTACGIQQMSALKNKEVWEDFAQRTAVTLHRYHLLRAYAALGEKHVRFYLEHLAAKDRDRLSVYTLPPLPPRFMERHGAEQMLVGQSQQRRRERSDILVPLYHVLVALIQMRKQAAERMVLAYREAYKRAGASHSLYPSRMKSTYPSSIGQHKRLLTCALMAGLSPCGFASGIVTPGDFRIGSVSVRPRSEMQSSEKAAIDRKPKSIFCNLMVRPPICSGLATWVNIACPSSLIFMALPMKPISVVWPLHARWERVKAREQPPRSVDPFTRRRILVDPCRLQYAPRRPGLCSGTTLPGLLVRCGPCHHCPH